MFGAVGFKIIIFGYAVGQFIQMGTPVFDPYMV